jgi:pyrimidine operon attenuation protein/uracil phosphoribosyltransferase
MRADSRQSTWALGRLVAANKYVRIAGTRTFGRIPASLIDKRVSALSDLSPQLRVVTVLFYFDDLKTQDIARILRIPHATVRTRLARARERLKSMLGDDAGPPSETKKVKQYAY